MRREKCCDLPLVARTPPRDRLAGRHACLSCRGCRRCNLVSSQRPSSRAGEGGRACSYARQPRSPSSGGLVLGVEVLSDGGDLTKLELSEAQAAPALRRTHKRAEHELEHRLLAEAVRDDLEPSPLLDEEALQKIRRPRRAAMRHRKPQVGDAGLEVVLEAGDRARQQRAVIGPNALGEVARDGSRWGLVTGARTRLELRPQVSRDLDGKVAHPMRKTALPRGAREALLDRPDDPWSTVRDDESSGSPRP